MSPGSPRVPAPTPFTEITFTTGMAWASVQLVTRWSALTRVTSPRGTAAPATTRTATPIVFRWRGGAGLGSGACSVGIGFSVVRRRVGLGADGLGLAAVDEGEHHRHE